MSQEERIEQLEMQVEQLGNVTATLLAVLISLVADRGPLNRKTLISVIEDVARRDEREGNTYAADLANRIIARLDH